MCTSVVMGTTAALSAPAVGQCKGYWKEPACLTVRPMMVLQESTHFDGQVLVAREAEGHQISGASHVVDTYEPVAGMGTSITLTALLTAILISHVIVTYCLPLTHVLGRQVGGHLYACQRCGHQ